MYTLLEYTSILIRETREWRKQNEYNRRQKRKKKEKKKTWGRKKHKMIIEMHPNLLVSTRNFKIKSVKSRDNKILNPATFYL